MCYGSKICLKFWNILIFLSFEGSECSIFILGATLQICETMMNKAMNSTSMYLSDGMYNIHCSTRQCLLYLFMEWNNLTHSIPTVYLFCWYIIPLLLLHATLVWMQPNKSCEGGKGSQQKVLSDYLLLQHCQMQDVQWHDELNVPVMDSHSDVESYCCSILYLTYLTKLISPLDMEVGTLKWCYVNIADSVKVC